jgi:hypothetical protein
VDLLGLFMFSLSFPRSAWERTSGTLCVPRSAMWILDATRSVAQRAFPRRAWEREELSLGTRDYPGGFSIAARATLSIAIAVTAAP